jgi:hypothetical protein
MTTAEITVFSNAAGPLTKQISLAADGSIKSDGSACLMSRGTAQRAQIADVGAFASLIESLEPNQAIALGRLHPDLPDDVQIVTKNKLNGQQNTIARTAGSIIFQPGRSAFALVDFDTKGIPGEVRGEIKRLGGYRQALLTVLPALRSTAHVMRRSTSAGLYNSETKKRLPGSDGVHTYLAVKDGADIDRFLRTLHDRCWLAGLGWKMVGAGGQLLDRSIVDRMVGSPERLVFEGGPILQPPLKQDRNEREPMPVAGELLDTLAACPPLTIVETAKVKAQKAKADLALESESAKARDAFIKAQTKSLIARTGMTEQAAARAIARQCAGTLHPAIVLPFDDPELDGKTVADVLADPAVFEGVTLADPVQGRTFGGHRAYINVRADGTPWIHSFAHGRTTYELKRDASSLRAQLDKTPDHLICQTFVELALSTDLTAVDLEDLRNLTAERGKVSRQAVKAALKSARKQQAATLAAEERKRRLAERTDPRPLLEAPANDAEWVPEITTLNGVLGVAPSPYPLGRDIDGDGSRGAKIPALDLHAFSTANAGE